MSVAFLLGPDGDLLREGGTFVRGDSLAQRIQSKLRHIKKEWFLNRASGVPWIEWDPHDFAILGAKNVDPGIIRQIMRAQILSVEGARTLDELIVDVDTVLRTLSVTFRVNKGDRTTITVP